MKNLFSVNKYGYKNQLCKKGGYFYLTMGEDLKHGVVFKSDEEIKNFIHRLSTITADDPQAEKYDMDVFSLVTQPFQIEDAIVIH